MANLNKSYANRYATINKYPINSRVSYRYNRTGTYRVIGHIYHSGINKPIGVLVMLEAKSSFGHYVYMRLFFNKSNYSKYGTAKNNIVVYSSIDKIRYEDPMDENTHFGVDNISNEEWTVVDE